MYLLTYSLSITFLSDRVRYAVNYKCFVYYFLRNLMSERIRCALSFYTVVVEMLNNVDPNFESRDA